MRPLTRFAIRLVCSVLMVALSMASSPPLPLPAWVTVELSMDHPPEIGGEARIIGHLSARLSDLPGARYEFGLPEGIEVHGGVKSGSIDLKKGTTVAVELTITSRTPIEGENITIQVMTKPPRSELLREIERLYGSHEARLRVGRTLVGRLPPEDTQIRVFGITVTPEEASFALARDPLFRRYLRLPGKDAQFALLDAYPAMDQAQVKARGVAALHRLKTFFKVAPNGGDDVVRAMVSDLEQEIAKLRYQEALLLLCQGKAGEALTILEGPDLKNVVFPDPLKTARGLAIGLAHFVQGDTKRSVNELERLGATAGLCSTARYVFFDLGEIKRLIGENSQAAELYRRALLLGPAFTLARSRLTGTK